MEKIFVDYLNKFLTYLPRIPLALIIIFAGWLLGKAWTRFYLRVSQKSKIDPLARKYIGRLVFMVILFLSLIISLSTLGLNISPFLAGIGAGGLIIGFGVRETVADFASGLMIFMYRPFKIGDYVKIGAVEGEVVNITPVNIELRAKDNKKILMPNRSAWGQVLYNSTRDNKNIVVLQMVVNLDAENVEQIVNNVFQNKNIKYRCFLSSVSPNGLTYTIYADVPKEMIFDFDQIIKELWLALKEKNITATISLQS